MKNNISIVKTEISLSVYKKIGNNLAVAESSIMNSFEGIHCETFYFNRINVPPILKGNGIGSELLDVLLGECKKHDISLLCEINPYGDISYSDLKSWYIRHGFKEHPGFLLYN